MVLLLTRERAMMIKIAEILRPVTHVPGMKIPIPGSPLILHVFPALLRVYRGAEVIQEIELAISGPVKEFTAQLDLVKGCINVWGRSQKGYFRYSVFGGESQVQLKFAKAPKGLQDIGADFPHYIPENIERLSLGSHKSQDWHGVVQRGDLVEILPVWYQLGQMMPEVEQNSKGGTFSLLKSDIESFKQLWLAGFEGMMSPRLEDTDHQGFQLPVVDQNLSPLPLLSQGWKVIRQMFFEESSEVLTILPHLPKEFHCGRLVGVKTDDHLTINIEWTKKQLRRMEIVSGSDTERQIVFPKGLKSYRLRNRKTEKGKRVSIDKILRLEKGKSFILDNFKK